MKQIDLEQLKKILEEEFPTETPDQIELRLSDMPLELSDELYSVYEHWATTKEVKDINISDVSLLSYMNANDIHFLSAIKGLSHLEDPTLSQETKERIRQIYLNSIE